MIQPNFQDIPIEQDYISLFASGLSINDLTEEDFKFIKDKTYMIGTNYFLLYYTPHLLIISDPKTVFFNNNLLQSRSKDFKLATRPEAFDGEVKKSDLKNKIDYWFNVATYKLFSNYTALWVIQMLHKFFPKKTILLFGFDFHIPEAATLAKNNKNQTIIKAKCYDYKTDYDYKERTAGKYKGQLNSFERDLETCVKNNPTLVDYFWNCNMESHTTIFKRKPYKELLT